MYNHTRLRFIASGELDKALTVYTSMSGEGGADLPERFKELISVMAQGGS